MILSHGSLEEVRRLIDILGESGRSILTTSHHLMDDVTVENVVAMYERSTHIGIDSWFCCK